MSAEANPKAAIRFIERREVERRVSLKRERIRQLEGLDRFPKRIALSSRRNVWVESEIESWLAARIAEARGAT